MEPKVFLNTEVCLITGSRKVEGNKVGVELELEGRNVGLQDIAVKGWQRHADGSLRGEAIEYTSVGPKTLEEKKKSVIDLFGKFKDNGVKFNDSIRTSTHVHLNFSDKTVKQMINFFTLFTMLEEVLQHYSGEDRKGNLFCISTREAEGIMKVLSEAVATSNFRKFAGDRYKYAACNLSSLFKFGTIEIRTMRGATSAEQVNNWLDILNDMYEYSANKMKSPVDLVTALSHVGAVALMQDIFSPKSYRELMQTFPAVQTLHYSLMEGARIIQVFAYEYADDFNAVVDVKKKAKGKEGESLPKKIPYGPFRGQDYLIRKPDGGTWYVRGEFGREGFWLDGERVADDPRLSWDEGLQRFVFRRRDGAEPRPCAWIHHHEIPAEDPIEELEDPIEDLEWEDHDDEDF